MLTLLTCRRHIGKREDPRDEVVTCEAKQHSQEPLQCCFVAKENVEKRISAMKLMNVLELLRVPVVH